MGLAIGDSRNQEPLVNGALYLATHKASVIGILGDYAPPVISQHNAFYNSDRWTLQQLVKAFLQWSTKNLTEPLTQGLIDELVAAINHMPYSEKDRAIVIAATPEKLSVALSRALVAGAYHEAFHTKYSCRHDLDPVVIGQIMLPRWPQVRNWTAYTKVFLPWMNIVEDIRIERRGQEDYEGTTEHLPYLQDFILELEAQTQKEAQPLSILMGMFRDLGLNYDTLTQREAYRRYLQQDPATCSLLLDPASPLVELLQQAINLDRQDDLGCFRVTLDILIALDALAANQDQTGEQQQSQTGDQNQPSPSEGDTEGKPEETDKGKSTEGKPEGDSKGKPEGDSKGKPEGDSKGKPENGSTEDKSKDPNPSTGSTEEPAQGKPEESNQPSEWQEVSNQIIQQLQEQGETAFSGLKTLSDALLDGIKEAVKTEQAQLQEGEAVWQPYTTAEDQVLLVVPSEEGEEADKRKARQLLAAVKTEIVYLRSRLRTVLRSLEMTGVHRGTLRGRRLSSRHLVDTVTTLRAGQKPLKAFDSPGEKVDMTSAAVIVLDESSSMTTNRITAARIMLALAEPLNQIGCELLVIGFRDGHQIGVSKKTDYTGFHRVRPVIIDIFKGFNEPLNIVLWRFACSKADATTPMADGIQYALKALSGRKEAHRFIFVVTDGQPNLGHYPVIKQQIRVATEAGIHIVGVGIGHDAKYVEAVFPNSVYAQNNTKFPKLLLALLNKLVDVQAVKRGRQIRKVEQIPNDQTC